MIRPVVRDDVPDLKDLISASELFPGEMLDNMLADYFGKQDCRHIWLTGVDDNSVPVSIAYCEPERMTVGTWNLLLIAVHPGHQGKGRGTALLKHLEKLLAERNERILLVETSGTEEFKQTRTFYLKNGFEEEGRIREFYQAGEDKIIFRKALKKQSD